MFINENILKNKGFYAKVIIFLILMPLFASILYAVDSERPAYSYAIVISSTTFADSGWQEVVKKLEQKHNAKILKWNENVEEIKKQLAQTMPKYTAIIARPEEAGHSFVVKISRMCRELDDDPYVDTFWGIVTGYSAKDALRLVSLESPLIVTRVLDATGKIDLDKFEQAACFDEFERDSVNEKAAGKAAKKRHCANDNTKEFISALNRLNPQLIATSAHATQHDWDMGYNGPNMKMEHENGRLFCIDTDENRFAVTNNEPKIYIGAGNCLIGDIDQKDCMATSWMHSGGACQFIGYTVPTWFGEMGWGTLDKFVSQGGVYTAAEAFHFNNTEIIRAIQNKYPQHVKTNLKNYDVDTDDAKIYRTLKVKKSDPDAGTLIGRLYDRDVVAFFGDPAFEIRIKPSVRISTKKLQDEKFADCWQIKIDADADGEWSNAGTYIALPHSMKSIKCVDTNLSCNIEYADNFIIVGLEGNYKKGDSFRIVLQESPSI
jgi:zinc protease